MSPSVVSGRFVESLETRAMLAFSFQFNYSYDSSGFFSSQSRRDVLTAAGQALSKRVGDAFSAISPAGGNTWSVNLINPSSGTTTSISNPSIPADTVVVYVGSRNLSDSTLGQGGPSGWSASGTTDWLKTVRGRGNSGATASPRTDFAPKVGGVTFDGDTPWFFGKTPSGITSTQSDFYSVAVHELAHVLGIGSGSETWPSYSYNGAFNGPKAKAVYGKPVPLSSDGGHFAEGISNSGQETALDPTLRRGVRKDFTPLDFAALDDIGYDIKPASSIVGSVFTDADNDGYRDTNESGVGGVRVFIDADKDAYFDSSETSVLTDSTGRYYFTGLGSGTYRIRQQTPTGYTAVKPTSGYRDVGVTAGTDKFNQDFSVSKNPPLGKITGNVFNDSDIDGYRDSGEAGLSGWRVFSDRDKDGVYDSGETSAFTDAGGNYTLSLPAGTYRVAVVQNGGYRRTAPASGNYDVTLASGGTASGKNFAYTQKVVISGTVIRDADGDGYRDAGEGGLGSWRVFNDTDRDGFWDSAESSTLTDVGGNWSFKGLSAGSFSIRVVQQTKYTLVSPSTKSFAFTLSGGQTRSGLNFFEKPV
ncbi:MAG TPA: SdrD B-like domain-containing protein [Tepidisphaeraceae bacterium]